MQEYGFATAPDGRLVTSEFIVVSRREWSTLPGRDAYTARTLGRGHVVLFRQWVDEPIKIDPARGLPVHGLN